MTHPYTSVHDTPATPVAYSVADAARAISVSRSYLYELIAAGELRTVTLGRRRVVPRAELLRLLGLREEQ